MNQTRTFIGTQAQRCRLSKTPGVGHISAIATCRFGQNGRVVLTGYQRTERRTQVAAERLTPYTDGTVVEILRRIEIV